MDMKKGTRQRRLRLFKVPTSPSQGYLRLQFRLSPMQACLRSDGDHTMHPKKIKPVASGRFFEQSVWAAIFLQMLSAQSYERLPLF